MENFHNFYQKVPEKQEKKEIKKENNGKERKANTADFSDFRSSFTQEHNNLVYQPFGKNPKLPRRISNSDDETEISKIKQNKDNLEEFIKSTPISTSFQTLESISNKKRNEQDLNLNQRRFFSQDEKGLQQKRRAKIKKEPNFFSPELPQWIAKKLQSHLQITISQFMYEKSILIWKIGLFFIAIYLVIYFGMIPNWLSVLAISLSFLLQYTLDDGLDGSSFDRILVFGTGISVILGYFQLFSISTIFVFIIVWSISLKMFLSIGEEAIASIESSTFFKSYLLPILLPNSQQNAPKETVDWLNQFIQKFWFQSSKFLADKFETQLSNTIEYYLGHMVHLNNIIAVKVKVQIGEGFPLVQNVSSPKDKTLENYTVDFDVFYDGKLAIFIQIFSNSIENPISFLNFQIESYSLEAKLQLNIQLMPNVPWIQSVQIRMLQAPYIHLKETGTHIFQLRGVIEEAITKLLEKFEMEIFKSNIEDTEDDEISSPEEPETLQVIGGLELLDKKLIGNRRILAESKESLRHLFRKHSERVLTQCNFCGKTIIRSPRICIKCSYKCHSTCLPCVHKTELCASPHTRLPKKNRQLVRTFQAIVVKASTVGLRIEKETKDANIFLLTDGILITRKKGNKYKLFGWIQWYSRTTGRTVLLIPNSESVLTIIPAREEIAYQFFECSSEDLDSIQETFKKFKLLNPFDPFPISIQTMDNITFKVSSLFFSVLDQQTFYWIEIFENFELKDCNLLKHYGQFQELFQKAKFPQEIIPPLLDATDCEPSNIEKHCNQLSKLLNQIPKKNIGLIFGEIESLLSIQKK